MSGFMKKGPVYPVLDPSREWRVTFAWPLNQEPAREVLERLS